MHLLLGFAKNWAKQAVFLVVFKGKAAYNVLNLSFNCTYAFSKTKQCFWHKVWLSKKNYQATVIFKIAQYGFEIFQNVKSALLNHLAITSNLELYYN